MAALAATIAAVCYLRILLLLLLPLVFEGRVAATAKDRNPTRLQLVATRPWVAVAEIFEQQLVPTRLQKTGRDRLQPIFGHMTTSSKFEHLHPPKHGPGALIFCVKCIDT